MSKKSAVLGLGLSFLIGLSVGFYNPDREIKVVTETVEVPVVEYVEVEKPVVEYFVCSECGIQQEEVDVVDEVEPTPTVSTEDKYKEVTRGMVTIVTSYGVGEAFYFDHNKTVSSLGSMGGYPVLDYPHMVWDNDGEEPVVCAFEIDGVWYSTVDVWNTIPGGWQNYLEYEYDVVIY